MIQHKNPLITVYLESVFYISSLDLQHLSISGFCFFTTNNFLITTSVLIVFFSPIKPDQVCCCLLILLRVWSIIPVDFYWKTIHIHLKTHPHPQYHLSISSQNRGNPCEIRLSRWQWCMALSADKGEWQITLDLIRPSNFLFTFKLIKTHIYFF